ncbi:unnamed protein product, partial [Vitis vinifera]
MSSISCANRIQAVPEIDQTKTPPNDNEFEPKFQFLRNRLMPDDLIRVLDTTHDLNSAIKVFKWASRQKRFRHTADTYFRVILKLGMGGKIEDMEAFCSEMVREKCPGGEETLIALISSFVKHRRLSEAIRVLVIMTSNGYKFSIIEFNGLLGALVRERRDFREILLVYKEIVKAGIVPNVDTLNYLIEALFELNWIDLALDQYRRMSKKGCSPNSKTFDILISGLIARNLVEKSVVVLGEMIELECEADLSFYTSVIPLFCSVHQLVETLCQMERIQEAAEVFCYMSSNGCALKSSSLDMLMKGICVTGKVDEAIRLLVLACYSGTSCTNASYKAIMLGLSKLGKDSDILVVLSKMLVEGCILDVEAYCILVQSMCALSRTEDIARFFNLMVSEGLVPDSETVATLLSCLTKHSQLHTILTAIGKLASDGEILNSSMYNLLIIGLLKEGYKSEACRLLDLMLEKGWVPDASTHGLLIGSVVSEVPHKEAVEYENSCMQDKIGNILAEGLRET